MERHYIECGMQVIALRTLRLFWMRHSQDEVPLRAWYARVSKARWTGPADVKTEFVATVDLVGDNRLIFDIAGNKYRLVVHVVYRFRRVLVKFIGTHAAYNKIDVERI